MSLLPFLNAAERASSALLVFECHCGRSVGFRPAAPFLPRVDMESGAHGMNISLQRLSAPPFILVFRLRRTSRERCTEMWQ